MRSPHVPARLQARSDLGGEVERLVVLARIDERRRAMLSVSDVEHLGEPPGLRVGDPLAQDLQGRRGAFEGPERRPRGCCGAGPPRVPARPRSRARSPRGSPASPPGSPRLGAGHAPEAEGARGAREAELLGERSARSATPIASSDLPWRASTRATSVSAPTSSGEGPSGSRSASASTGSVHRPRIPEPDEHAAERAHRAGGGGDIAARAERRDRLLQGLGRLGVASGLEGGLAEAGERLGPFGMSRRGERERPLEVRKRRGGVQPERTLPGEGEEPQRRCLELGGLLGLPGGPRELQGRRVVVGEDVGEVLDPLGGLGLDPARRGDVTRGPRGSGELAVGDVAGQDVPEGVLGLALDRGTPGGTHELLAGELPERVGHRR